MDKVSPLKIPTIDDFIQKKTKPPDDSSGLNMLTHDYGDWHSAIVSTLTPAFCIFWYASANEP